MNSRETLTTTPFASAVEVRRARDHAITNANAQIARIDAALADPSITPEMRDFLLNRKAVWLQNHRDATQTYEATKNPAAEVLNTRVTAAKRVLNKLISRLSNL
jgi:hypothetical protein